MVYKASIYRFLKIHTLTGLIVLIISFPVLPSADSSIALIIALFLSGVLAIFLTDYRRKNIVFSDGFIEGPFRVRLHDVRISFDYEQIDFENCIRPSIMKNGAIFAKDGRKIILYSMYFGKRVSDQIFNEIETKTNMSLKRDREKR